MKIDLYIAADSSDLLIVHEDGTMVAVERGRGQTTAVLEFSYGNEATVRMTPILSDTPYVETRVDYPATKGQRLRFTERASSVRVEGESGPHILARWE